MYPKCAAAVRLRLNVVVIRRDRKIPLQGGAYGGHQDRADVHGNLLAIRGSVAPRPGSIVEVRTALYAVAIERS
jgi:hypothetical protein